jgi:hypothetical protein
MPTLPPSASYPPHPPLSAILCTAPIFTPRMHIVMRHGSKRLDWLIQHGSHVHSSWSKIQKSHPNRTSSIRCHTSRSFLQSYGCRSYTSSPPAGSCPAAYRHPERAPAVPIGCCPLHVKASSQSMFQSHGANTGASCCGQSVYIRAMDINRPSYLRQALALRIVCKQIGGRSYDSDSPGTSNLQV